MDCFLLYSNVWFDFTRNRGLGRMPRRIKITRRKESIKEWALSGIRKWFKTSWTGCSLFKGHLSCQRCRCKSLWTSLSWNHEPPPGGVVCSRSSGSLEPMTVPLDGCSILIFLFPLLWCYSEESNLFVRLPLGNPSGLSLSFVLKGDHVTRTSR